MRPLRLLVTLSATALCDAYQVYLKEPYENREHLYTSIENGTTIVDDVKISMDGLLDVFPCQGLERPPDYERLKVPIYPKRSIQFRFHAPDVASRAVGAWHIDYWFGQYEGAAFQDGADKYTWQIAMFRAYRMRGSGDFCSMNVVSPYYAMRLGEPRLPESEQINRDDLEGVNATLAIRFSYFNLSDDLETRDLVPTNVTTQCVWVEFTTEDVDSDWPECDLEDKTLKSPEAAISSSVDLSIPSESSSIPSETSSWYDPWESGWDDMPYDDNDFYYSGDPPIGTGVIIGIVMGLSVCAAAIAFICVKNRRNNKNNASAIPPVAQTPGAGPLNRQQRRVDSEVVQDPAPAYQPAGANSDSELLDAYRSRSVPGGDDTEAARDQPPIYGDLPPRYEEADGQRSRGD